MKNATKLLVITKKGEISANITNALMHCRISGNKIYTGYYSGRGRFTTAHSAYITVSNILQAQGYKFEAGNDAPKGGVTGEYVKCSKVAINFINSLKN